MRRADRNVSARGWLIVAGLVFAMIAEAADADRSSVTVEKQVEPDAPEWRELAAMFARRPDAIATFEERRVFPFRKTPIVLAGEVRVSRQHGLSLHYTSPEERIVILDTDGVLMRDAFGERPPPNDPRARAANEAMFHILRLDFEALEQSFEIHGARESDEWMLALTPRDAAVRRALGTIFVTGDDRSVRRIELRRSARQYIDIAIAAPREVDAFSPEELKRYFR